MKKSYYCPRILFQNNRKIVVQKTIYKCNNHCIFCVIPDCFSEYEKMSPPPTTAQFKKIIDRYATDEKFPDTISFTSAEPTLRPDIIHLLEYTMEKYPNAEIQFLTNGRMFSHKQYVNRLKHLLPRMEIHIPLHGPSGEIHDRLTSARRSFAQTVQGIKNIFEVFPKINMNIRILVHQQNYQHLDKTVSFIMENFPWVRHIILIYISMIGDAKRNHGELALGLAEMSGLLAHILKKYKTTAPLLLFHIPYCIINREFWDMNAGKTLSEEQMEFPLKCSECLMRDKCCGFWESEFNEELFKDVCPIK